MTPFSSSSASSKQSLRNAGMMPLAISGFEALLRSNGCSLLIVVTPSSVTFHDQNKQNFNNGQYPEFFG